MTILSKKLNKYFFFDIETSKTETTAGIVPVVYLTCLLEYNIAENKEISTSFTRTLMPAINNIKKLNDNGFNNIVYIHNLSYEYRFIFNAIVNNGMEVDLENSIFTGSNNPIKVKLKGLDNIEFRCSYALLDKSVKALGEEVGTPKLEYDHNIKRLPFSNLTDKEYEYNKTDCLIVAKAIAAAVSDGIYGTDSIPLTKTAIVRKNKLQFIKKYYKKNTNGRDTLTQLKNHKKTQLFSEEFYSLLLDNFKGGVVGSNHNVTNKIVNNVYSIDIKSSYPSVMMEKFPLFTLGNKTARLLKQKAANDFVKEYSVKKNCYHFIGTFKIKGLKSKIKDVVLHMSDSDKIDLFKGSIDLETGEIVREAKESTVINGKVLAADEVVLSLNEVDFELLNKFYSYDRIICNKIFISYKQRYLPEAETSFILSKFMAKENSENAVLKKSSKIELNSLFGEKVMKQVFPEWRLAEDGYTVKEHGYLTPGLSKEERTQIFNERMADRSEFDNNINIYADGIWITSYARKKLMEMQLGIVERGGKVIYVDTDSVKFTVPDEVTKTKVFNFINNVNKYYKTKNKLNPAFKAFKELLLDKKACMDIVGKKEITTEDWNKMLDLGTWQFENHVDSDNNKVPYGYFKTLGSKKYVYTTIEDGSEKIKTVLAGCSIKFGDILNNYADENGLNKGFVIDIMFKPGILLTPEVSGRTVTTINNPYDSRLQDIQTVDGEALEGQYGGLIIDDATYLLNLEAGTAEILIGLNIIEQEIIRSAEQPAIFNGTALITSGDENYQETYEKVKSNIFKN